VTPDDLCIVQRTWEQLRTRRATVLSALIAWFDELGPSSIDAAARAGWLFGAVDELVGLLAAPSSLATRARALGATWPDPLTAPSFAIEGRAWLAAGSACAPTWSDETATAWKQAWLLLSDVLAAEALSPFVVDPNPNPNPRTEPNR
jgi:hypothetical protein